MKKRVKVSLSTTKLIQYITFNFTECFESEYWLELLFETGYLVETQYKKLNSDCGVIRKMLISSCKTLKEVSV